MRRNDNIGNMGYLYEENVQKVARRCKRYYMNSTDDSLEFVLNLCDWYQVDYNDVIRAIKIMIRNDK